MQILEIFFSLLTLDLFSGLALCLLASFCSIFPSHTIVPKERTNGNYLRKLM
jgi:hypothetical protein